MGHRKSHREITTYFEINKNKTKTPVKNLWDADTTVMRGKLITLNTYIKKKEKS